ncbi:hypothetical protein L2E82_40075 [Cichorium intybus]|uniref:Uncharacterized protein n=1 Tax=Cichorium intybus TaxID=13427 RepID=A0ACB9AJG0_CICIN|nr:hypothetical protein L2E82_40075 [Cichorium intybus]
MAANVGNGSVCFVVVFVFLNYLEPKLCWFDQEKWRDRSQGRDFFVRSVNDGVLGNKRMNGRGQRLGV